MNKLFGKTRNARKQYGRAHANAQETARTTVRSQTPTQTRGYAKRCLSHRLTTRGAKRPLCLTVLLTRGSLYFQPLHTRHGGKHWFMLVSSSLTAARPFPDLQPFGRYSTGFSYTASLATRYSVLPHKAFPTKNIVNIWEFQPLPPNFVTSEVSTPQGPCPQQWRQHPRSRPT